MNQPPKKRSIDRVLLGNVLMILVLMAVFVAIRATFVPVAARLSHSQFGSPLPTPTTKATEVTGPALVATKAALELEARQTVEAARRSPQPTGVLKPTPTGLALVTSEPTAFVPAPNGTPAGAGQILAIAGPFSGTEYHIKNTWYVDSESGRTRTYVYAGSLSGAGGGPSQQGAVIVQALRMSLSDNRRVIAPVEQNRFLTPSQAGAVKIVGASGERLVLESPTGVTFYFDVPARRFVSSLTWVSPIATPTPPAEP